MQVLFVAVIAIASFAVSTTSELKWSNHYAQAKTSAAQQQRPLLVVLENSTDPAGKLDQERLSSQADLLKQYELCRMDVNTAYGKKVAAAFGATDFPFTAITDKSAKFITYRGDGNLSTEQLQQVLTPVSAQRVQTSKIITDWPTSSTPGSSYCPSCVRNQYYQ